MLLLARSIHIFRRVVVVGDVADETRGLASTYCGAIGFGLIDPITPILFTVATPSLISQGHAAIPAAIGGTFLGSHGWWPCSR